MGTAAASAGSLARAPPDRYRGGRTALAGLTAAPPQAGELKPQVPPLPPHLYTDRLNNNVQREPSPGPAGGFWRAGPLAARGGRSSEYFRNHRPEPLSAERAALWVSAHAPPTGSSSSTGDGRTRPASMWAAPRSGRRH